MIQLLFELGSEVILVVVDGKRVTFGNSVFGNKLASIDGLRLSKRGVEKEFPDLIGKDNWREEAVRRFKIKLEGLDSELERAKYIIRDLKSHAYKAKSIQKQGFRPEVIKDDFLG